MENAIALIMTMLVLALVGIPLLRDRKPEEDLVVDEEYEDSELDRLLSQKDTAVEAIRELEFDHAVGSLSDEDYADLKQKYERKAISVLKNLKEIGELGANDHDRDEGGRTANAARAKRGEGRRVREFACPECLAPHREEDRFCASCGIELGVFEDGGLSCPECGYPYEEENRFCASCGAELGVPEEGLAPDGDDGGESIANEEVGKTVEPEKAIRNTQPKRQTRRASNHKKSAGNNGKGA